MQFCGSFLDCIYLAIQYREYAVRVCIGVFGLSIYRYGDLRIVCN